MTTSVEQYLLEGCGRCELGGTPDCKVHQWKTIMETLRHLVLEAGLTEECKWGVPTYTYGDKNVVMISAFKKFCSISFLNGVTLNDPEGILEKPGPNSHIGRLVKLKTVKQLVEQAGAIKNLLEDAIQAEREDRPIPEREKTEDIPPELEEKFKEDPNFKSAFEALTPGRQRGYLIYFSGAKQSKTRRSRIEKYTELIFKGQGIHDEYNRKN